MLKSNLILAFRLLLRRKGYTFINVFGLAVAMTVCLLIGLYIQDELSYNRFHEDSYRMILIKNVTPYPLASALEAEVPEVVQALRTWGPSNKAVVREVTQLRADLDILIADTSFFSFFTFPMISGSPVWVLSQPDAAVITEETARLFFGDEDPVGQILVWNYGEYRYPVTVSGVVQNPPTNSTIQFDMVVSLERMDERWRSDRWRSLSYRTYALLHEGARFENFKTNLLALFQPHYGADETFFGREHWSDMFAPIRFTSYYLSDHDNKGSDFAGHGKYLYIFGSIALLTLLIAGINYINLILAQAIRRGREVGIRKTIGAKRSQLVRQFLGETVLVCIAALVLAISFTELVLPYYNGLFEKDLSLNIQ